MLASLGLQAHLVVVGYHHVFSSSGSKFLVNHEGTLVASNHTCMHTTQ